MNRFSEFIRERQLLYNVSPATVSWYSHAFKWLPSESPTQADLKGTVLRMREAGLKETGCNAVIRAVNAYLHWGTGAVATVTQLVEGDFFKKPRTIGAIVEHCKHNLARSFKTNEVSGKLVQLVRTNQLTRTTNADKQYEYKKP
jgi:hypothetical protein